MVTQQEIRFTDEETFYKGVAECVRNGLTFEAFRDTLCIHLTGGC
jgi:hypothetical protein